MKKRLAEKATPARLHANAMQVCKWQYNIGENIRVFDKVINKMELCQRERVTIFPSEFYSICVFLCVHLKKRSQILHLER